MRYHETPLQVRFHEVDTYGVVWHGHYIGWFEAGRNDLTERFHLGPLQLKERISWHRCRVDLSVQTSCHFWRFFDRSDDDGENRGSQTDFSLSRSPKRE